MLEDRVAVLLVVIWYALTYMSRFDTMKRHPVPFCSGVQFVNTFEESSFLSFQVKTQTHREQMCTGRHIPSGPTN